MSKQQILCILPAETMTEEHLDFNYKRSRNFTRSDTK